MKRRLFFLHATLSAVALTVVTAGDVALAQTPDYPAKPIELVVPFAAGGGTDALARAFGEAARKHLAHAIVVVNKPGASSGIGLTEVANSRPDGYKIGLATADMDIIPHLGLTKTTYEKFVPVARLNADPSAITVRADSQYTSIEALLDAARKTPGSVQVGNAGNGSIWHLAAAALEDKVGVKFNHIPFNGGNPAVLALLGGHVDAVAVSPAEVAPYVAAGKLKMLAVMADQRVKGFESVPTLKERNIDLSIGTWRGIVAPRNTPPEVLDRLRSVARTAAAEPSLKAMMAKQNLGYAYADKDEFGAVMAKDYATFKALVVKLGLQQ
ncbi:putative BUG-like extracytoplasmic solute binding receptor, TTT family [Cupriavidus necator]|uniref:Putative BUG-like extracytoplasmic solute binding receptor, TTT family n=1 Tax=Cupriavidus necator TaxID=106590 RepID=A0A1K0I826_CUPNE|nr:putative BUG-like extracytoplasmic solute binding receptor, TTT family [Cupriavidus necator]